MNNLSLNKFAAGFLALGVAVLTAAVAIPEEAWSQPAVVWQFGGLILSTILVIFLPLAKGAWAGALKIIGALGAALVANVLAFFAGGGEWGFYQWLLLGLAVLQAVAAELGVNVRVDQAKQQIESPEISSAPVEAVDPKAVEVAVSEGARHAGP